MILKNNFKTIRKEYRESKFWKKELEAANALDKLIF